MYTNSTIHPSHRHYFWKNFYCFHFLILFFSNHPIKNKIPIKNAGIAITNDSSMSNPAKIKPIPPTISYFREIIKIIVKINAGILCINKPTTICQAVNPIPKISNENIIKKRTNITPNIRGAQ